FAHSTSNHNTAPKKVVKNKLFLLRILHQITTCDYCMLIYRPLFLLRILHQITTVNMILPLNLPLFLLRILHQITTILR
ncbi:hypothetical protein HMPREF0653_02619, partial [Prevotella disiens JCM 6334 = ATCC 29426]